jgi:hypothetical protein
VVITSDVAGWRGAPDELQVARAIDLGGVLVSRNRTERRRFRRYVEAQRATRGPDDAAAAAASVLLLPRHASTHATDAVLLLRTTILLEWYLTRPLPKPPTLTWNDAQQALVGGWRPAGYAADQVRIALGQLPAP